MVEACCYSLFPVEVKTRCTSSSFVCFSVHLLPDDWQRLPLYLFLSQRQQEKKVQFISRCCPHHRHKETPASLPATHTSLYNFLFCGRSLKELSAGRSKYMITNIRICMVPEKTFVGFLVAKYY
ncbi:hypothetical protein VPH35_110389 [Triticum aestivum]